VPQKQHRRRRLSHSANGCGHRVAQGKDDVWAWDFIYDRDARGRPLKWFRLVDEYTWECLVLEVERGIREYLAAAGVQTLCIEPGAPWQNGYAESFHSRLRDKLLAACWKNEYNPRRPHSGLGYRTPAAYAASLAGPLVGPSVLASAPPAAKPSTETLITLGR